MNNRIPRKFNKIVCEMLVNTNVSKIGDILHVYKNDYGYAALNTSTNEYSYCFLSMLRNENVIRIKEVA